MFISSTHGSLIGAQCDLKMLDNHLDNEMKSNEFVFSCCIISSISKMSMTDCLSFEGSKLIKISRKVKNKVGNLDKFLLNFLKPE